VAAALIQAHPNLVGMAGFDSETGRGMGHAIKESGRAGRIVATRVEAEEQRLHLLKKGVLTALVGQQRELFTYRGSRRSTTSSTPGSRLPPTIAGRASPRCPCATRPARTP
jgi:hypothetical protein